MDEAAVKKAFAERTACKKGFNALAKRIENDINAKNPIEIVEESMSELKESRKELKERHTTYLVLSSTGQEDEDDETADDYLDAFEKKFSVVQSEVHKYRLETAKVKDVASKAEEKASQDAELTKIAAEETKNIAYLRSLRLTESRVLEAECTRIVQAKDIPARVAKSTYTDLRNQLEKMNEINNKIVEKLNNTNKTTQNDVDRIVEIRTKCIPAMEILKERKAHLELPSQPIHSSASAGLQLPKLPMPSFSGNIRDYPRFKRDFNKIVLPRVGDNDPSYTLMSCLQDDPRSLVTCISDDVAAMWARLDEVYGDPSKVVDVIISEIKGVEMLQEFDHKGLVSFIDLIEGANADLTRLDMNNEINNAHSVGVIEGKLPPDVRLMWSRHLNGIQATDKMSNKFPHLLKFLLDQRRIIEYADSTIRSSVEGEKGSISLLNGDVNVGAKFCLVHETNGHDTVDCRTYATMNAKERVETLMKHKACFNCLKRNHLVKKCQGTTKCEAPGCDKRHHTTLHQAHVDGMVMNVAYKSSSVLLQLMQVKVGLPGSIKLTILWDSAAEFCLITFTVAKRLELKGEPCGLSVTKVGGETEETNSYKYIVPLQSKDGSTYFIEAYGIHTISSDIRKINLKPVEHLFPNTQLHEIERPSGQVDVLIGYNYAPLHPHQVSNPSGNLVLVENEFGKCLGGSHELLKEKTTKYVTDIRVHLMSGKPVMESFIKGENMGVSCWPKCGGCSCGECSLGSLNCSIKEQKELELIESNLEHMGDHWETTYPWIKDPTELTNNRLAAEGMMRSTERRLLKNPDLKDTFIHQMQDLLNRNVARKLSLAEMQAYDGPVFYLGYHEVMKKESTSTPCRIVFSSKQHMGQILNDFWAKGPDLLNNPLGIIFRFREGLHAMIGDIKKMYHTVKLKGGVDQHTHRFLYRECDPTRPIEVFALTTVTFGDRPAGTIAAVALKKTADMHKDELPVAADIIKNNAYVDDIADSFDTMTETKLRSKEVSHILKTGGFHIKEWVFSSKDEIDQDYDMWCTIGDFDSSILGCKWNTKADTFNFKVRINFHPKKRKVHQGPDLERSHIPHDIPTVLTKRLILSQLNGIWDPQGLSAPIIIKGKISMRNLWQLKLQWDEPIPDEQRSEWVEFFRELFALEELTFRRCLKPHNAVGKPTLVIFCDGSEEAYGAVAYIRWQLKSGEFECRLALAKCRIAPIRQISIIRLELNGALTGARLKAFIYKQSRYDFENTIFIVDSKSVHAMIKLESIGFHTYTALRVGEIQELTDRDEWFWIEGQLNIADIVTRKNAKVEELNEDSVWQRGPSFLTEPMSSWPVENTPDEKAEIHEKKGKVLLMNQVNITGVNKVLNFQKFSSFTKMKRVVAWILKAVDRMKKVQVQTFLTRKELQRAEKLIMISAQRGIVDKLEEVTFKRLSARKEDGLVVVGGRAEKWINATWNQQKFVLLDKKNELSEVITREEHIRIGHLGVSATVASVRSQFWIIGVHTIAKRIRNKCVDCKTKMLETAKQKMCDLPIERLKPCPPFTNVGVDYFGPFTIKGEAQKRIHSKCYGVIIVCMVARAVYADITTDYATDSLIQLLRRFGSRHGWPAKFHADSGSQLKGAPEELKKVIGRIDHKEIQEHVSSKSSEWHFIPPEAPWMNGVTESLVKSIKRSLINAIGAQILSYSEMQTVMFESAELVNERPIGRHPTEPDDGCYLCPNDLILGRSTSTIPQGEFDHGTNLSRRFRFIQTLVAAFWRKWNRDFFPSLVVRSKWHVERRNVKIGDVVILRDANALRGSWRLARVINTMPNEDGIVRRIIVRCKQSSDNGGTKMTELERAAHNVIVVIPVDEEDDNEQEQQHQQDDEENGGDAAAEEK